MKTEGYYKDLISHYSQEYKKRTSLICVIKYTQEQTNLEDVIRIAVQSRTKSGKCDNHQTSRNLCFYE
jgi:hypothetical protein